tara:strand:+ start:1221 stop:1514 length:294 start_codon:yes stop_codon:yes gene_type:complete
MDNRYYKYGCPPLMSDGRFLTSYVDSDVLNQYIRNVNKLQSANDFRIFLQKNGDMIMNKERAYLVQKNTCSVGGTNVPAGCGNNLCRATCKCHQENY